MANIIKTLTLPKTTLDIYEGPIGVMVSGGADSAILLCLLMKYNTGPIYVFTTGHVEKRCLNVVHATKVIHKCMQLTGNSNILHRINYCETSAGYRDAVSSVTEGTEDIITKYYSGITANPPESVIDTFVKTPISAGIDITRDPMTTYPTLKYDKLYQPWINIDKSVIAKIYDMNNLRELFAVTRSCECFHAEDEPTIHCGECWWCQERQWGFGSL
jgi:7-cyano-7-deazaguanine synthase in queuosine biosynthesis